MFIKKLFALAVAAGFGLAAFAGESSAAYPEKPIRLVIPNSPGGSTDRVARLFQQALQDSVPQPIAAFNVVGGGTTVGNREVKDAAPDGYTMLMVHQALFTSGATGVADFGPEAFEPVALTGADPSMLVVRGDAPFKTLKDLFDAAKKAPKEIKAGVAIGALNHISILRVQEVGGVEFRYVQTGGGGPSLAKLLGGHIDLTYLTLSDATDYIKKGDVRVLALFIDERLPAMPNLPTAVEQGYQLVMPIRHMWWMPKGTPKDRVAYIAAALERGMQKPEVKQTFEETLTVPLFVKGDKLSKMVAEEYESIKAIVEKAGIKTMKK